MILRLLLAILVAYALGCLNGAYYLVRLRTGGDIRKTGSGGAGAKNAARALGGWGFAVVFAWDVAKGAAAVAVGRALGLEGWALGATVLAAVAGHVWPAQLQFRGGRGIATAWGAFLVYAPWMALVEAGFAGLGALAQRRFTRGGMVGILFGVVVVFAIAGPCPEVGVLAGTVALAAFTHRTHLAKSPPHVAPTKAPVAPTRERVFRRADRPEDFEQIAGLNYRTFVEEIPQHERNVARRRVDPFVEESTCFVCLEEERLIGMLAVSDRRPFSLDRKIPDLDRHLPNGYARPCEVRLLAVEQEHRGGPVSMRLILMLIDHCRTQGYDLALISAAGSQERLYAHLGFEAFGPPIGTAAAPYQGMYVTADRLSRTVRRLERRAGLRGTERNA